MNKVLKGSVLLSPSVHKMATALLHHEVCILSLFSWLIIPMPCLWQVPLSWSSLWDGPVDPVNYLRTLVAKTLALRVWQSQSDQGTLLTGEPLDLSDLFHPATFLNALRQQTARWDYCLTLLSCLLYYHSQVTACQYVLTDVPLLLEEL